MTIEIPLWLCVIWQWLGLITLFLLLTVAVILGILWSVRKWLHAKEIYWLTVLAITWLRTKGKLTNHAGVDFRLPDVIKEWAGKSYSNVLVLRGIVERGDAKYAFENSDDTEALAAISKERSTIVGDGTQKPILEVHENCRCRQCLTDRGAIRTTSLTGNDLTTIPTSNEFVGMIVCSVCGNKRCPHATNHIHACTNSNDTGQSGSIWENSK